MATAITVLLLVVLLQVTAKTAAAWRFAASKAEQFREARQAFEVMNRRIGQATLNTYQDYDSYAAPRAFVRRSELRFVCGPMQSGPHPLDAGRDVCRPTHGIFFQAPFGYVAPVNAADTVSPYFTGLESALNTWGYYLEVSDDEAMRPEFVERAQIPPRVRSRLMEFMQPSGAFDLYRHTSGQPGQNPDDPSADSPRNYAGLEWFQAGLALAKPGQTPTAHVLAENIVALILLPKLSQEDAVAGLPEVERQTVLAPGYYYHSAEVGPAATETSPALKALLNTRHQLPPIIQVTMVAIDETSAQRLARQGSMTDPFELRNPSFATTASSFKADLLYEAASRDTHSLEKRLIDQRINYRIFTSNVYPRGAKWSRTQTP